MQLVTLVGVDMPIGLPESWGRPADDAARRFLGRRASTVFPTPPRSLLEATTYDQANALSRRELGRGLSRQTFNLFPKIREVDALMGPEHRSNGWSRSTRSAPSRSWPGKPLPPKRTADGAPAPVRAARGSGTAESSITDHCGAQLDDVLDAYAVLWSAERFARGEHVSTGRWSSTGSGLPMRIVT